MNATIKTFLRTDQQNKDGSSSVCLRLTKKRKLKIFTLKIRVRQKDWNFKNNRVKKTDIEHFRKNKYIIKYENKAQNIIDNYFFKDKDFSFNQFSHDFKNDSTSETDFFEFVKTELNKKSFVKATYNTYRFQISKIEQFDNKINIHDIDYKFLERYKKYMIEVLNNKPITWNKSFAILKVFLNWAVKKDILETNPVSQIKIQKHNGSRTHLTSKELVMLENLKTSDKLNENDKITLNYFLFSCYTGLRYTDVKNLKFKNIKNKFVKINAHKTGKPVSIPIIRKCNNLLPKNINIANKNVFEVACNQVTNKRLKKIMQVANIDKNISFHCARHTFATVGVSVGIPIEVISDMLGHTEIRTTQIYTKIGNELKAKELQKFE